MSIAAKELDRDQVRELRDALSKWLGEDESRVPFFGAGR